ncbi:Pre-mRNA-splicing factor 3 [Gonapodya prolifera JEL478]|uniref:Pre-mRNA-splicing factor 3 n=1 Tax=Gonapodya prolifera (strain JEL478) TaxID=1344416 RepID=A0A139A292_GONPJ|nr:Pre-mRNA-splicing factor 3 [Gonapodya prolifera JEL478]|eukprot:KXS10910.1 Pre-mRNA-splicing factor 3 [Gonapodya prolifera JEL478]
MAEKVHKPSPKEDHKPVSSEPKNPYLDSKPGGGGGSAAARKNRQLSFVEPGTFVHQANKMRAQAQLEKLKREIAETVKKTGMDAELELVGEGAIRVDPPPEVEWWDVPLLSTGSYADIDTAALKLDPDQGSIITVYVQHPVPLPPPVEPGAPAPKPLMLTKKEQRKLRRQNRMERQKEKQDQIRLGFLPPDPPKVRISNMMRVLGNEAVQDPTKVEAEVRKQMEARRQAHKQHNAAKKLSEAERRQKKIQKLIGTDKSTIHVAVFRINDLSSKLHRLKVEHNATQLQLSGVGIVSAIQCVVIVEGTFKALKFYKKLMLRRIDWSGERVQAPQDDENSDSDEEDKNDTPVAATEGGAEPGAKKNECLLIWEGELKDRQFRRFRIHQCPTELKAKELLEGHNAVQYWDLSKSVVLASQNV